MKLFRRKNLQSISPEEKIIRNKYRVMCTLSGVLLGLGFPPVPFPAPIFLFIALIPYLFVLDKRETLSEINKSTYLTAFVFNLLTIYWVGSWGEKTDPFLMIAGTVLVFFNPILFLIPSTLFYLAKENFNKRIAFLLFPFFWVFYEYAYMATDASFPWLSLSNGLPLFLHFVQIANIVGALGLSLIVVFINVFLFLGIKEYRIQKQINAYHFTATFLLIIIPLIYGFYSIRNFKQSDKQISVGLIQPNLDPWDKWSGGNLWDIAEIYFNLSKKAADKGAQIIFWPETALPVYLLDGTHQDVVDSIYSFVNKRQIYLLTGMPDFRYYPDKNDAPPDAKYSKRSDFYYTTYNGIMLFSPYTSYIEKYGKMKLVPFGERVPFVDVFPFIGDLIKWEVGISGWNKGRDTTVFKIFVPNMNSSSRDTIKINSLVCFESVYPDFVAQFIQRGAQFISVVTNDSWYGNSSGPYQHKEIGVLRAVENRRAVVRAANGGISTIIDPVGRTEVQTKMYTKDFIVGRIPLETHMTFFSKNPFMIPVLSSVISILIAGLFFLSKLKKILKK